MRPSSTWELKTQNCEEKIEDTTTKEREVHPHGLHLHLRCIRQKKLQSVITREAVASSHVLLDINRWSYMEFHLKTS
ncbi:hypothetical protein M758_UG271400 [Ceratodon purpureus]|nr:hypothetical protein M758_UG271400 [Ceratodon purpureus]